MAASTMPSTRLTAARLIIGPIMLVGSAAGPALTAFEARSKLFADAIENGPMDQ